MIAHEATHVRDDHRRLVYLRYDQIREDALHAIIADEDAKLTSRVGGVVRATDLRAVDEEVEVRSLGGDGQRVRGVQATLDRAVGGVIDQLSAGTGVAAKEDPLAVAVDVELVVFALRGTPEADAIGQRGIAADLFDVYRDDHVGLLANGGEAEVAIFDVVAAAAV